MNIPRRNLLCQFNLSSLLLVISLLSPLRLFAADQPVPESVLPATESAPAVLEDQPASPAPVAHPIPSAREQPETDVFEFVDTPRNYVSEKIIGMTSYIDYFFAGNRHYQESNQSVFKLDLTRIKGYGDNQKFELSGNLSLRLPGTEGRLRLWVATETENYIHDSPTKDTHTQKTNSASTGNTNLGARFLTDELKALTFGTDVGIKLPITHLDPFVRSWVGYAKPVNDWRLNAIQSVYWYNSIGHGETTQFDMEKDLSSSRLFRSSTSLTWLDDTNNFDLAHSFSVYHTVNNRSVVIYQTSAAWITNPGFRATDYVALVFYRYRMRQKWLFLELSPQLHFPWDRQYRASPAFSMRLEALFDETN
ncbi:MAG: hypothetical protein OEV26_05330 [Gallionella sp.]|nr:hypothetical protein [Gallionella sp.]